MTDGVPLLGLLYDSFISVPFKFRERVLLFVFLAGICGYLMPTFRNGVLCLNDYFLSYGQN